MRLSDFLLNIGRPVAFYPGLAKALGSIKQAVFICQMAYWKDKGDDPNGWIYKTAEDIETETALTYKEQTKVRADLVEKKALQERYARTEHLMYFRVDWDVVNTIWDEHLTKSHMPVGKVASYQKSDGILPKVSSLNSNTENTTKNTQKKEGATPAQPKEPATPKANSFPEIVLFREVTRRYPNSVNFEDVVSSIQKVKARLGRDVTKEDLLPFYKTWASRGHISIGLGWLDWAVSGKIGQNGAKQAMQTKATNNQAAAQRVAERFYHGNSSR